MAMSVPEGASQNFVLIFIYFTAAQPAHWYFFARSKISPQLLDSFLKCVIHNHFQNIRPEWADQKCTALSPGVNAPKMHWEGISHTATFFVSVKWRPPVTSPISLWTAVLKTQDTHYYIIRNNSKLKSCRKMIDRLWSPKPLVSLSVSDYLPPNSGSFTHHSHSSD